MLHEFLTRHRDEIIDRCERTYRNNHPGWTREELLDTIPQFVDEIIRAERREAGLPEVSLLPGVTPEARAHGRQRFDRGVGLRDVAMDYGTISRVIGEVAIEHGVHLDPRSYKLLNECIDAGIAAAIETYFELAQQRGHQQVAEWLGALAHELRNSLASAVLAYSFIRTGQVGPQSSTSRVLDRSFNQLEALVSQMLVAVQLRSGMPPLEQPIALRELVEDIDAGALHERGITVSIEIDPELTVVGDPRLLGSAITNLVQNALKFTRQNGRIQIRAAPVRGGVEIEVEDECGGLAAAPEALFRPFVQFDQKQRGVGLGLAITRDAIEAHRGTLSVRDLPGRGCIFAAWIPSR